MLHDEPLTFTDEAVVTCLIVGYSASVYLSNGLSEQAFVWVVCVK